MAFGRVIEVQKVENPTEEQIDEVHQKIINATKQMFDLHKASLGWGDKEMEFVWEVKTRTHQHSEMSHFCLTFEAVGAFLLTSCKAKNNVVEEECHLGKLKESVYNR